MDRPIKILFLAANPKDTSPLRLDEEIRGIDQALRQAEFRDRFDIKQQWAVRVSDLQSYFLRYEPDIVHFSGHGSASNEIILEDNDGNSQSVSNRALTQLFSVLKDNIRCVVLNACYSEQQAQAIAKNIDCVIGMSKAVGDSTAISFAVAFYQALGFGRDVKTAFDLGCPQIDLESLGEQETPKLVAINSDPQRIVFVNTPLAPKNFKTDGIKGANKRFIQNRKLKRSIWVSIIFVFMISFLIAFVTLDFNDGNESKFRTKFNVTVRVYDSDGQPIRNGQVIVNYGQTVRREPIAENGEANIKDIPIEFINDSTKVFVESSGYVLDTNRKHALSESVIEVTIRDSNKPSKRTLEIVDQLKRYDSFSSNIATVQEARQMLRSVGIDRIAGPKDGDYVTGQIDDELFITIWPKSYDKENVYGVRYGKHNGYWDSNKTYFEIIITQR